MTCLPHKDEGFVDGKWNVELALLLAEIIFNQIHSNLEKIRNQNEQN